MGWNMREPTHFECEGIALDVYWHGSDQGNVIDRITLQGRNDPDLQPIVDRMVLADAEVAIDEEAEEDEADREEE